MSLLPPSSRHLPPPLPSRCESGWFVASACYFVRAAIGGKVEVRMQ